MFCVHCGMKLSDDTVFCPNCGHKVQRSADGTENIISNIIPSASSYRDPATIAPGTKFCTECGAIMFPGSDKCRVCGKTQKLAGKAYVALTIIAIIILIFTVSSQYQELKEIRPKAYFLDSSIRIIVADDKTYYHKYGCSQIAGKDFWAYNIEAAKSKGYKECSYCWLK